MNSIYIKFITWLNKKTTSVLESRKQQEEFIDYKQAFDEMKKLIQPIKNPINHHLVDNLRKKTEDIARESSANFDKIIENEVIPEAELNYVIGAIQRGSEIKSEDERKAFCNDLYSIASFYGLLPQTLIDNSLGTQLDIYDSTRNPKPKIVDREADRLNAEVELDYNSPLMRIVDRATKNDFQ